MTSSPGAITRAGAVGEPAAGDDGALTRLHLSHAVVEGARVAEALGARVCLDVVLSLG